MPWVLAVLSLAFFGLAGSMLHNFRTMKRLAKLPLSARERWPAVSVVVPARNEGKNLEAAMTTRMRSDYPGLEVILIDDRSEDDTGAIADRLAAEDPRVTVVHNTELPDGWLGKVHALDLGAARAKGEWILFSDGDVEVAPGTLRRAVAHAETGGFDLVAAIPPATPAGPWVGALHSIFARLLFAAGRVAWIEDPGRRWALGVGAFTLVRRRALEASAGFAALRLDVADDLRLASVVKQAGARCTLLNGTGAISVDLYPTLRDFFGGVEKSAWSVMARFRLLQGILGSVAFLAVELSPLLFPLLAPTPALRLVGLGLACAAFGISAYTLVACGRRPWVGLLYPLGSVLFAFGVVRGTVLGWWRGGLTWRGTFYPTEVLRAAGRERPMSRPVADAPGSP